MIWEEGGGGRLLGVCRRGVWVRSLRGWRLMWLRDGLSLIGVDVLSIVASVLIQKFEEAVFLIFGAVLRRSFGVGVLLMC